MSSCRDLDPSTEDMDNNLEINFGAEEYPLTKSLVFEKEKEEADYRLWAQFKGGIMVAFTLFACSTSALLLYFSGSQ
eukprot:6555311-Pyramimonas_sp.AAC.1